MSPMSRTGRRFLVAVTAMLAVAIPLAGASSASAVQSDLYDPILDCPTDNPLMTDLEFGYAGVGCVGAITNGGSFRIRSTTTEVTKPVHVQFGNGSFQAGLFPECDANGWGCLPTVQGPANTALRSGAENVPGGLLGMAGEQLLKNLLGSVPKVLAVHAKTRLAGKIDQFNLTAPLGFGGPAFILPVKIQLQNPVLGSRCYIGSNQNPIVLRPEFTTLPTLEFAADPNGLPVTTIVGSDAALADDSFSVPRADGCGPLGLLDAAINNRVGLPSPSGANEAILLDSDSTLAIGAPPGLGDDIRAAIDAAQVP